MSLGGLFFIRDSGARFAMIAHVRMMVLAL
jgi:hypothetical protein